MKLQAIYSTSAFFGIGIFEMVTDFEGTRVTVAQVYEDKYSDQQTVPLDCDDNGESYFIYNDEKYLVNDFMKL